MTTGAPIVEEPADSLVFFLDVDNTLLDNDRLKADMEQALVDLMGVQTADAFWRIYEEVRVTEEYVDLPATITQFIRRFPLFHRPDVDRIVMDMPFQKYIYPHALDALAYLDTLGTTVILSDGDPIFQIRKIERSGLAGVVGGRVRLTVHKQTEMDAALAAYPAPHHVMIDDKTVILADLGTRYAGTITTVLVKQGKYSRIPAQPQPEVIVDSIGDLVGMPRETFTAGAHR